MTLRRSDGDEKLLPSLAARPLASRDIIISGFGVPIDIVYCTNTYIYIYSRTHSLHTEAHLQGRVRERTYTLTWIYFMYTHNRQPEVIEGG